MFTKRFNISWIGSSLVMFALSYIWHGLFLTDFSRLSYPKELFLVFAAFVYLIIGFVMAKAIDVKLLENHFKRKPIIKGAVTGAALGFTLFIISTVVGVSFSTSSKLENLLLDVCWQVIEQSVGGVAVGLAHFFIFDPTSIIED
jgi:membrane protease YdiL (CAAX protease family)